MEHAQFRTLVLGEFGQPHEPAQVGFDQRADAGAAHLDDHLAAVLQTGTVHLGNGCRRQRLRIDGGKNFFGRRAEVNTQLGVYLRPGHGGRAVLQAAEFGNPFRIEQINTGGQYLAQLDEGRPHFFQRTAHAGRGLKVGQLLRFAPAQHTAGFFQRIGQSQPAHHVAESIADQDGGNLLQATQVARRDDRLPQHQ